MVASDLLELKLDQHPECASRTLGSAVVVITPRSSELHTLDDVAAYIFKLCDGGHTGADIVEQLTKTYDVERELAESDTRSMLISFIDKQMVVAQ